MARSKSAILTEAELRIMNVLWDRGAATVHSHELLVLNLLEEQSIDAAELARVRQLLEKSK